MRDLLPLLICQVTDHGAQSYLEDDHGTSHMTIVDSNSNAVSMTTSCVIHLPRACSSIIR